MRARIAAFALATVFTGCGLGSASESASECGFVSDADIDELLGEATMEYFMVATLEECVFTSNADPTLRIDVRVEVVPDAELFVEHAIEATDPDRVQPLQLGDGAVLFEDEAVLGRTSDQVVLVTGTIPTDELVAVLSTTLERLDQR